METLREELMAYIREHYLREDAGSYKQVALSFLHFAQRERTCFSWSTCGTGTKEKPSLRTPTRCRPSISWR